MTTAFLAHAQPDRDFATSLAAFLESGCNLTCYVGDAQMGEHQDLIAKAEEGLSADVLLLLLSPSSSPARWVRERWEPVLFDRAKLERVDVVTMLLEECSFPALLRRRNFIDATRNALRAQRLLKRWFTLRERNPGVAPSAQFSGDLEDLYLTLADRAGMGRVTGAVASRFASEAEEEFEAVLWVPCQGRTLAQASGELSHRLGLTLDGPVEENCGRLRELLAVRRCLVVLDAPSHEVALELTARGRTSTVITQDPVRIIETPETLEHARSLIDVKRFAEAYEVLYRLRDADIDAEKCARELTWICEHWDRTEEANMLRWSYPASAPEQLALF